MIGTGDLVRSPRLVRKCDRSIPPAGRSILSTADHTTTVHAVQSPRIGYRASRNRNTDASFRGCTRPHKWSAHQKARAHVSAPNADLSPTSHLLTTGGLPGLTGESNGTQIHFAARTFQRPRPDDYPDPPARSSDRNHGACQRARCLRAHRHHAGAAARHPVKREWMPAGISRSYRTPSHPSPPPHSISVDEPFPRDALAEIRPDPSVGGARTGIEAIPLDNHPTPSPRSRNVSRETSCCVPSSKQRTRGDGQHDPLTTVDQRRTT